MPAGIPRGRRLARGGDAGLTPALHVEFRTERGPVRAVDGVSFSIAPGEVLGLAGESGSGKSTIALALMRVLPAPGVITGGQVQFRDQDVLAMSDDELRQFRWRDVSMVFQDPFGSLNPVHTVGHHLERPLQLHGKAHGRHDTAARIEELLATVGLNPPSEMAQKFPHELSGGQRQRVSFARALAVEPEVVLADEPISMLDVSIRMGVLNMMERLKEERGIAYLYITRDIASARYIGDEITVMYAGRMVEGGETEELIANPAHPYTRLLFSAVPNPNARGSSRTVVAKAEPPRLVNPPPGCPFAPRCPHVMPVCKQEMPGIIHLNSQHWTRCHLYGKE